MRTRTYTDRHGQVWVIEITQLGQHTYTARWYPQGYTDVSDLHAAVETWRTADAAEAAVRARIDRI